MSKTPEEIIKRCLADAKDLNGYAVKDSGGLGERLLKVAGHTTGMIIRLERQLKKFLASPAPPASTPEPLCKRCNQPRDIHGEEPPYDLVYGNNDDYCEGFSYVAPEPAPSSGPLLRDKAPAVCHCPADKCMAPVIMGRQMACLRRCCENGTFGQPHECRKQRDPAPILKPEFVCSKKMAAHLRQVADELDAPSTYDRDKCREVVQEMEENARGNNRFAPDRAQPDAGTRILTDLMMALHYVLDMGGKLSLDVQIQMKKADAYLNLAASSHSPSATGEQIAKKYQEVWGESIQPGLVQRILDLSERGESRMSDHIDLMKVRIYLHKNYYLGQGRWTSIAHRDAHTILCEIMEAQWRAEKEN